MFNLCIEFYGSSNCSNSWVNKLFASSSSFSLDLRVTVTVAPTFYLHQLDTSPPLRLQCSSVYMTQRSLDRLIFANHQLNDNWNLISLSRAAMKHVEIESSFNGQPELLRRNFTGQVSSPPVDSSQALCVISNDSPLCLLCIFFSPLFPSFSSSCSLLDEMLPHVRIHLSLWTLLACHLTVTVRWSLVPAAIGSCEQIDTQEIEKKKKVRERGKK